MPRLRSALVVVIVVTWAVTLAAVGLGSDGFTAVCTTDGAHDPVPGYTWARDYTNDCVWTLYSGSFPVRGRAPDAVYHANGLTPPPHSPMLERWQIVLLLVAISVTGVCGLWHERLPERTEEPLTAIPVA